MMGNRLESEKHCLLMTLLNDLESELQKLGIWQKNKPSESALSSVLPFAIDTLTFVQWLQFIFIERMRYILRFSLALPESISVTPMAEEYFKHQPINSIKVLTIMGKIDCLISENK